ncbi:protein MON2 homolog [Patella vulgata]|uniref:protein MON2 homolog n=1 Tax=Patella vulgata TaxID=6465 RepID=UPI00218005FF|nr:protein MON2 homolog [Patella vulgata]
MRRGSKVCQHPYSGMRNWGAEAVTSLVRAALAFKYDTPLEENLKLQKTILAPLQELSNVTHSDIRQKQLECVLTILHNNGYKLLHGWPLILGVIGAVKNTQSEKLVQTAFQSLQLVVADFLPIIPSIYLKNCVEVAGRFGLQNKELNVSLTAIGLLWNISDFFYQNRQRISDELNTGKTEESKKESELAFDDLWMSLFSSLGDLCVDDRPAVRKSSGQTLFSTISAHGGLLQKETWKRVLWQVLFPLLEKVQSLSSSASTTKDEMTGNILIHHSRDTAEKQWAETRVLSLAGVARTFNSKRQILHQIGDFPRAWSLLLEHIENSALCPSAEVSLAALKSFQEILQLNKESKTDDPKTFLEAPSGEEINRTGETKPKTVKPSIPKAVVSDVDIALWATAWKVWLNIGTQATKAPDNSDKVYVPSQKFLTALIQTFPPLFIHIRPRFVASDLNKLSNVLVSALSVPVQGDASPFIIPTYPEVTVTPLQEVTLQAMEVLIQAVKEGAESTNTMFPEIFEQLLTYIKFGVQAPKYGHLETKVFGTVKGPQVDWVTMNFVPFSEKTVDMVVDLYSASANNTSVIKAHVLHNIIKTFRIPLGLKYSCPSPSTWKLVINALFTVLEIGLPVARKHVNEFEGMWCELALAFEDFLFTKHPSPPTLSVEEFQRDEAVDCKVVTVIRDDILPYASNMPKDFVIKIMEILNKGSIHSATSDTFIVFSTPSYHSIDTESSRKLREEFAKTCFETLLQFSFINQKQQEEEGCITKIAVLSLLQRCQEVVKKYVDDERLSGKCPLPRPRMAEMSSVLKAISTLLGSLKRAPKSNVEAGVWKQVINLYPYLVECTTSASPHVCKALKDALHEYKDLLTPPISGVQNGT